MSIRQEGTALSQIRDDHVARYRWAEDLAKAHGWKSAIDAGCGVGYGAQLLALGADLEVYAFDHDQEAIATARHHYSHPRVRFFCHDLRSGAFPLVDVVTMFEVIEHSRQAEEFLRRSAYRAHHLLVSAPNEDVVSFLPGRSNPDHYRHYTPAQLEDTLRRRGWEPVACFAQVAKRGPGSEVLPELRVAAPARTILVMAESRLRR